MLSDPPRPWPGGQRAARWGRRVAGRLVETGQGTGVCDLQESPPDRARDGLTARKAPGRSGLPRTWLTRVRWAAWRVRTAARERPGLTGGRPPRGRPGLVGIHR